MYQIENIKNTIIQGDCLAELKKFPDECVDCVVSSPPYWSLRSYLSERDENKNKEIGLEPKFNDYTFSLIKIFNEIKRVLKKDGTCFVNLGDTYFGGGRNGGGKDAMKRKRKYKQDTVKGSYNVFDWSKNDFSKKSLVMIPERFALEMLGKGWILRNKIVWHKKNAMPSSVLDRLSNKYELIYFFVKSPRYYFDIDSIRIPYETNEKRPAGVIRERERGYNSKQGTKQKEQEEASRLFGKRRPPKANGEYERNPKGKNPGDVWTLTLQPHPEKHIAMFPEKLIMPIIKAGCPQDGIVLDPFMGSGTTAVTAKKLNRNFIGIDLNKEYCELATQRLKHIQQSLL